MDEHYLSNEHVELSNQTLVEKLNSGLECKLGSKFTYVAITPIENQGQNFPVPFKPTGHKSWMLDFVFNLREAGEAPNPFEAVEGMSDVVTTLDQFAEIIRDRDLHIPQTIFGSTESLFLLKMIKQAEKNKNNRNIIFEKFIAYRKSKLVLMNINIEDQTVRSQVLSEMIDNLKKRFSERITKIKSMRKRKNG